MSPRLFCAVVPPEPLRAELARAGERLARSLPPARAVDAGRIHLTLRFLGDTPEDAVPAVTGCLDAVAARVRPFPAELGALGVFPGPRRARVLWCGIARGRSRLEALARELDRCLAAVGLGEAEQPFRPHLTLARWRTPPPAGVGDTLATPAPSGRFPVDELLLIRSDLGNGPPRYTVVHRSPLGSDG